MTDARAREQLRQERETFDQAKAHGARWFTLRLELQDAVAEEHAAIGTIVIIDPPLRPHLGPSEQSGPAEAIQRQHDQEMAARMRGYTAPVRADHAGSSDAAYFAAFPLQTAAVWNSASVA